MKNGILEFLGGAFLFTALSYATGKAYYNGFFRSINVEPALVDLAIDQIFFEGGRQLVSIFSMYLIPVFIFVGFSLLVSFFASISIRKRFVNRSGDILGVCSQIKGLFLIVFFVWFANFAFNSAVKSGEEVGANNKCLLVTVHSTASKEKQSGCLVYKTADNIWLKYTTGDGINVSIFPRDNFYRVDVAKKTDP